MIRHIGRALDWCFSNEEGKMMIQVRLIEAKTRFLPRPSPSPT